MKRITITLACFFLTVAMYAQTQKDSLPITKTETQSTASYTFTSSFKSSKTKLVKDYLDKELGNTHYTNGRKYTWDSIGVIEEKADKVLIELKPGHISMNWHNKSNPANTSAIIKRLEMLATEITKLIRD